MALEQFHLEDQVAIVTGAGTGSITASRESWPRRDRHAINSIFQVDGGIHSNNSPLPIPDY